ncbi:hypothetical protein ACFY8W_36385 [Streptomyces sp. NPDC012637]|uniref:hypothetical protein n=1 Tax=Streptomyces sp. NPDC012637 TaxID=3364842 RepID=UPI0036EB2E9C
MGALESKRSLLIYAKDITIGDVTAINSFLSERIAQPASAQRGSDERQVARSVRAALMHVIGILQHSLPLSKEEVADADSGRALRLQVVSAWNTLWALTSPWQRHEEYNLERWRHVKYWDPEEESMRQSMLTHSSDADSITGSASEE